ncbi:DUF1289 domain-containing protein [Pseudoalteromonas sp. T1lg65]|uniref:DUF1289 domain-containing protein n=1 Tax=Pseudoalteromonas sp. T1lg65 TaxID=2077101 RepID=UPI003F7981A2
MSSNRGDAKPIDEVESPCIRQCCLDDHDVCVGCYRTLEEILNWSAVPAEIKREILSNCEARKKVARKI